MIRWLSLFLTLAVLFGAARSDEPSLPAPYAKLAPLHSPLAAPQPGEWLWHHDEPGQSLTAYKASQPIRSTKRRSVLYIQPLGEFSATQQKILNRTAEYMHLYFGLPLWLCPICLAKLTWATGTGPIARYERLAAFCKENGLIEEAEFFRQSIDVLQNE